MATSHGQPDSVSFLNFTVDLRSGQLLRHGRKLRVQEKPFQILELLLERPGEIVTRDEIRAALWSEDTFVDFDHSISAAIGKLRSVLGDSAEAPRYIETLGRRGYRFIAEVSPATKPQGGVDAPALSRSSAGAGAWPSPDFVPATPSVAVPHTAKMRTILSLTAMMLVVGAMLAVYLRHRANAFRFTPKSSVVVADFLNTTGDTVFDGALKQGLNVGLEQSPMIQILSDEKSAQALREMARPNDQTITGKTAIEVCLRSGSKIIVQGSISSLGSSYLIGLTAIRCDSAEPVAHEQLGAKQKENVIEVLGRATAQLRARLGESLSSVQKYDVPLVRATTSSLEALKLYSQGFAARGKSGDSAAVPFFERAIGLDPSFGLVYGELATLHANRGEIDLARQNASQAYALRDKVTEFERLSIEGWYHIYVTGDLEAAIRALEIKRATYPQSAASLNDLGATYGALGLFDKEVDLYRDSLRIDPLEATTYGNLAMSLLALNRSGEARAILMTAKSNSLQSDFLFQVNYWMAFLNRDKAEMQQVVSQASGAPEAWPLLLSEEANTEAYFGHFDKARQLSTEASNLLESQKQVEGAGMTLAQAAVREAEIGNPAEANNLISRALKFTRDQNVLTLAALVAARNGDSPKTRSLAQKLESEYPADILIQRYWLPTIRAEVELRQDRDAKVFLPPAAVEPFDFAQPPQFSVSTLYPTYVRGQVYLRAGLGEQAAAEFQKILDHPGMVLNFPLGALARLGIARAHRLAHQNVIARKEYETFLELWQDADPTIPILVQAKREFQAVAID